MRNDRRQLGVFAGDPWPFVLAGAVLLLLTVLGLVWLGGTLGAWAYGAGWNLPPFSPATLFRSLGGEPVWPGVPTAWTAGGVGALTFLLSLTLAVVGVWAVRRWGAAVPGLATLSHVKEWTFRARRKQAYRLRPSLAKMPRKKIEPADVGLPIGKLAGVGVQLLASLEDVLLIIAGPRSGKTSRIVAGLILAARGFCIVTSARYDAYSITQRFRERFGKVALFDPQRIAHAPQTVWWDILAMARTLEGARRLAMHLSKAEEDSQSRGGDAFFTKAGRSTLTNLLHAAAIGERPLAEFLRWTSDQGDRSAARILRDKGLDAMADGLERMSQLAQETQDGVFEHVRQAVQSLYDPDIARWVTPQPDCQEIKPAEWVGTRNTLYMLSKDGGGGAAGVIAALTDTCFIEAVKHAEATPGGRLDPTMLAVLDEAANVCKIEDLPKMYSYLGGYGIQVATVLQSYKQGAEVWGNDGMDALWGAATVKLLGAGLDDYRFLDELSHLVGMRAIAEESLTSSHGGTSTTRSKRRERVLDASDVRELERGTALMLGTSTRPALVEMEAYYERSDADTLVEHKKMVDAQIAEDARRHMKEGEAA